LVTLTVYLIGSPGVAWVGSGEMATLIAGMGMSTVSVSVVEVPS